MTSHHLFIGLNQDQTVSIGGVPRNICFSRAEHVMQYLTEYAAHCDPQDTLHLTIQMNRFADHFRYIRSHVGIKFYDVPQDELVPRFLASRNVALTGSLILAASERPMRGPFVAIDLTMRHRPQLPTDVSSSTMSEEQVVQMLSRIPVREDQTFRSSADIIRTFAEATQFDEAVRLDVNGPRGCTANEFKDACQPGRFVKIKHYAECWSLLEALKGVHAAQPLIPQRITNVAFHEYVSSAPDLVSNVIYPFEFVNEFLRFQQDAQLPIAVSDVFERALQTYQNETIATEMAYRMMGIDLPADVQRVMLQYKNHKITGPLSSQEDPSNMGSFDFSGTRDQLAPLQPTLGKRKADKINM